jgi:hypothetical protein
MFPQYGCSRNNCCNCHRCTPQPPGQGATGPTGPQGIPGSSSNTGPTGPTGAGFLGPILSGTGYIVLTDPSGTNNNLEYSQLFQVNGTGMYFSGDIIPTQDQVYNIGSASERVHTLFVGTGTIDIAQDPGAQQPAALIGSDLAGFVYTEYGFSTPFVNIGPIINVNRAVGGWRLFSDPTGIYAQQNTLLGPTGDIYAVVNISNTGGMAIGPTGPTGIQGLIGPTGPSATGGGGNVIAVSAFSTNNALITSDLLNGSRDIKSSNLVTLDNSGNMSGLNNVTSNTMSATTFNGNATSSTTSIDFSGSLNGEVTGVMNNTQVASIQGIPATTIASSINEVINATPNAIPSTLVIRDIHGGISATSMTATNFYGNFVGTLSGTATYSQFATNALNAANFTNPLVGDVTGNQTSTIVSLVGGQSAATVAAATVTVNAATSTDTGSTLVLRDAGGNFSASIITSNLTGNVTGNLTGLATNATNAVTSINFSGSLSGDVSGNQTSTIVNTVGGQSAANVAAATLLANQATSSDIASTIVRRDGAGNFSAGTVTATTFIGALQGNSTSSTTALTSSTATYFSAPLHGDVIGPQYATTVAYVGGISAASVATGTQIALTATSNDMPNTVVLRNSTGTFSTQQITIDGPVVNPNDTATKAYVDQAVSLGFVVHPPAIVVSTSNVALSGLPTIDGVTLVATNRVLLINQSNPIENGLWVAAAGAWTRPSDFLSGTLAGEAYVLILEGTLNQGSSWVCSTPTAIIDTNPVYFQQFSIPGTTTAANVGVGQGQIYQSKVGQTLNFKTLLEQNHIVITNGANEVDIGTDATSLNTSNTLVARDSIGGFAGSLTGAASSNVLKTGDTMTGPLVMALQTPIQFQDLGGTGGYVGIRAPTTVPVPYTFSLPYSSPTAGQVLQATSSTTTAWFSIGGSPAITNQYYVSKSGNDSNDGSFGAPFLTVAHALSVANTVSSLMTPTTITVESGIYIENNSGGPLPITADFISIVGTSIIGTIIVPLDAANDLFAISTTNVYFQGFSMTTLTPSSANAVNLTTSSTGTGGFNLINISNFATGISLVGPITDGNVIIMTNSQFHGNGISVSVDNLRTVIENCLLLGPFEEGATIPLNTGITVTGSTLLVNVQNCSLRYFQNAIIATGGSVLRLIGSQFGHNISTLIANGGSTSVAVACSMTDDIFGGTTISVSGNNTYCTLSNSNIQGPQPPLSPTGTGVLVTGGANMLFDGCTVNNFALGIQCGVSLDTSTTQLLANGTVLLNCIMDIEQFGTSTLSFVGGNFSDSKTSVTNSTNVSFAGFDTDNGSILALGTFANVPQIIYQVLNGLPVLPILQYQPNYYGTSGTVYIGGTGSNFNAVQSTSNATKLVITQDRTAASSLQLISDTNGTVGNGANVRGWILSKTGTSADLLFNYSNNDTSGQVAIAPYTLIELSGVNDQILFPLSSTGSTASLIWGGDTDLYRAGANTLKTDGIFVVGSLTGGQVVISLTGGQLGSSVTTSTELSYLSGVTSSIQNQLNGKVNRSGDTMTGSLTLPAGSIAVPSLQFSGSVNTGVTAATPNVLSLVTNGVEALHIDALQNVYVDTLGVGIVHSSASGQLTSSLIVNADISASAAITDNKLATISTAGKVANSATTATNLNTANTIVSRDASGNFIANVITASLNGNATTSTTSVNFSGPLAGDVTGTQSATIVSFVGGQTAANVATGTQIALTATPFNIPNTVVQRDGSGGISVGSLTASTIYATSIITTKPSASFNTMFLYNTLTLPSLSSNNPYDLCFFSNTSLGSLQTFCAVCLYATGYIAIVNVSNPLNPVYVSSVAATVNGLAPQSICTDGSSYLYTVGQFKRLSVYNVTNAAAPTTVTDFLFDLAPATSDYQCSYGTISGNNYVFVSSNRQGFNILNVTTPATPSLSYQQGGGAKNGAGMTTLFSGTYVANVLYNAPFTLQIWNCAVPTAPVLTTFALTTAVTTCQCFGNTLYLSNSTTNVLTMIDVTNPTSPFILNNIPVPAGAFTGATGKVAAVINNMLYVNIIIGSTAWAYCYDINNRYAPNFITSINTNYACRSILSLGNLIYFAGINSPSSNPCVLTCVSGIL